MNNYQGPCYGCGTTNSFTMIVKTNQRKYQNFCSTGCAITCRVIHPSAYAVIYDSSIHEHTPESYLKNVYEPYKLKRREEMMKYISLMGK